MAPATIQSKLSSLIDQVRVHVHLSGVKQKRWVRCRVLRPMPGNRFNVTGIGYNTVVYCLRDSSSFIH